MRVKVTGPETWILVLVVPLLKVLWGYYLVVSQHFKFFLIHLKPHKTLSISGEIAMKRLQEKFQKMTRGKNRVNLMLEELKDVAKQKRQNQGHK